MDFRQPKSPETRSIQDRFFNNFLAPYPLNKSVFLARREDADVTESLNEIGTTDLAIGDATAEMMITTPGPLPNIMYDLEETTINTLTHSEIPVTAGVTTLTTLITEKIEKEAEMSNHRSLFTILTVCFVIVLLFCLAVTCAIAKSRRFSSLNGSDCEPDCAGAKQPLLIRPTKFSESTSKTSSSGRQW